MRSYPIAAISVILPSDHLRPSQVEIIGSQMLAHAIHLALQVVRSRMGERDLLLDLLLQVGRGRVHEIHLLECLGGLQPVCVDLGAQLCLEAVQLIFLRGGGPMLAP